MSDKLGIGNSNNQKKGEIPIVSIIIIALFKRHLIVGLRQLTNKYAGKPT